MDLKLHFRLLTNDESIIDEIANYTLKGNIIQFSVNKDKYTMNKTTKKITKKNSETLVSIDATNQMIYIELLQDGYTFSNKLYRIDYIDNDNIITITYEVDKEEQTTNKIIIEY